MSDRQLSFAAFALLSFSRNSQDIYAWYEFENDQLILQTHLLWSNEYKIFFYTIGFSKCYNSTCFLNQDGHIPDQEQTLIW